MLLVGLGSLCSRTRGLATTNPRRLVAAAAAAGRRRPFRACIHGCCWSAWVRSAHVPGALPQRSRDGSLRLQPRLVDVAPSGLAFMDAVGRLGFAPLTYPGPCHNEAEMARCGCSRGW